VLFCDLKAVVLWDHCFECIGKFYLAVHDFFVYDATRGNLAEHLQRVKPCVDGLQANCLIDCGDSDTLDVDYTAMGFGCDLLSLAAKSQYCHSKQKATWSTYSLNPT
jgi:hypothetical protein